MKDIKTLLFYIRIFFLIALALFVLLWFFSPTFQKFFKNSEAYSFYEESKARIKDRNENVPMTYVERSIVYLGWLFCAFFIFFNYLCPENWTFLSPLSEILSGHVSWVGGLTMVRLSSLRHVRRQMRYSRLQEKEIHRLKTETETLEKAATEAGAAAKEITAGAAEHAETGYKYADAFAKSDVMRNVFKIIGAATGLAITAQAIENSESLGLYFRQTCKMITGEITRQHYWNSFTNPRAYHGDEKILDKNIEDYLRKKMAEDPVGFYKRTEPYEELILMRESHNASWSTKTIPKRDRK